MRASPLQSLGRIICFSTCPWLGAVRPGSAMSSHVQPVWLTQTIHSRGKATCSDCNQLMLPKASLPSVHDHYVILYPACIHATFQESIYIYISIRKSLYSIRGLVFKLGIVWHRGFLKPFGVFAGKDLQISSDAGWAGVYSHATSIR